MFTAAPTFWITRTPSRFTRRLWDSGLTTWNRGWVEPYDNGGKDTHIAFRVDDFDAFHALHEEMGCIVKENPKMGLYFISDPDGCWIEILPEK